MPVGYLITLILFGACILFSLFSVRRPPPLRWLGFRVAVSFNEIPFLILLVLIFATLAALPDIDLGSAGGIALLAVAALEAVGFMVILRRGLAAGPVVDAALGDGLGAGWRQAIRPEHGAGIGRRPSTARILMLPIPAWSGAAFRRETNISYGDAGRMNLLDLYRPRRDVEDAPVLIFMHGGGYHGGRKSRESRALFARLTRRGWICVTANYRLRPEAGFTDHLADMKKVIAWVRDHGREYGADPAKLFAAGSSAGAHLAALAALTAGRPELQPGLEGKDTAILGAICLSGYFGRYYGARDDPARPPTSPSEFVEGSSPPLLIAHGELDSQVPVERARELAGSMGRVAKATGSGPVVYAELPGGQHSFDLFHSFRYEAVIDGIEAFTAWVLS